MGDIEIPRDIRKYESKLVGPFTTRQTICFVIAVVCFYIVYRIGKAYLDNETLFAIGFIVAVIPLSFGFIKPYGTTLENFLSIAVFSIFIVPRHRVYQREMMYDYFNSAEVRREEMAIQNKRKKAKKSKDHDLRPFK